MPYDSKPWLRKYDPGVLEEIDVPDIPFGEQFDRIVDRYPDKPAVHFLGVSLTYRQVQQLSNRFARALCDNGCRPGDVVGIHMPNIPQYLIAQVGVAKAGCAGSGISPLLTSRELAYQLNDSKAAALVTLDATFEKRFVPVANEIPDLKLVTVTGILQFLPWYKRVLGRWLKKAPTGAMCDLPGKQVLDFMAFLSDYPDAPPNVAVGPDDRFLVQYTGGTTGLPKGTILTHRNIVTNQTQVEQWVKPDYGNEILLSAFPMFHLAGLCAALAGLAMGSEQILVPNPRDTRFIVKQMAKFKPSILVNVPSLYMMLLEDPDFRTLDFSRIKFCMSGASPFPADCIRELERVVGEGKIMEVYGLTEASPIITMNPRKGLKKIGSVGLPVGSTRVRLVDLETGTREVAQGEEGEIICSGGQVMQGYLNKPEETAIALREHDGALWLHTGDVARMDEDGFFFIVDRTKDMLNVGGFKVFSREVEEKLYEHPTIELCAIIGVPNPKRPGSELVKLVVQKSKPYRGKSDDEVRKELLHFAQENFSPYKVPKIIEFIETMPLTLVGKVDKKALR